MGARGNNLPSTRAILSVTLIGAERVGQLKPIWESLYDHHAVLSATSTSADIGELHDLDQTWKAQQAAYQHVLRTGNAFLAVAERDGDAVGFALVVHRRSLIWNNVNVGSIDVLAVKTVSTGGIGAKIERGRTILALLSLCIEEGRRRGLSRWTASCLSSNAEIRRIMERLGGKEVRVTYQGSADTAAHEISRLGGHR
jgi:hypothetical protein